MRPEPFNWRVFGHFREDSASRNSLLQQRGRESEFPPTGELNASKIGYA